MLVIEQIKSIKIFVQCTFKNRNDIVLHLTAVFVSLFYAQWAGIFEL